MIDPKNVNWTRFNDIPTLFCKCGEVFGSKCAIDYKDGSRYAQVACPKCGSHTNIWRISHDKEPYTIDSTSTLKL